MTRITMTNKLGHFGPYAGGKEKCVQCNHLMLICVLTNEGVEEACELAYRRLYSLFSFAAAGSLSQLPTAGVPAKRASIHALI